MGKNIGKNIIKNLSSKYSQKLLNHAKQSAIDSFKTASKRAIQKTVEATVNLVGNKIADRITKVLKTQKNIRLDTKLHTESYISPKTENYWWCKYNIIMEYQKIVNLLDHKQNKKSKFRTRNWVEINDESQGTYNAGNQIKFKTSMIRSNLCDYSNA